jgi:hypothetical protein
MAAILYFYKRLFSKRLLLFRTQASYLDVAYARALF